MGLHKPELSELSLSTEMACDMPMQLERSLLTADDFDNPLPPGFLSYPAATAANVGLPFLPGKDDALVSLGLVTAEFILNS